MHSNFEPWAPVSNRNFLIKVKTAFYSRETASHKGKNSGWGIGVVRAPIISSPIMTSLILFPVIKGFSAKNWNSSKAQDISETVETQINMQIWEAKIQFFGIEIILCFR